MPSADLRDVYARLAAEHDRKSGTWLEKAMRQFRIDSLMDDEPREMMRELAECFDIQLPPETIQ